jgi:hypothetical protein
MRKIFFSCLFAIAQVVAFGAINWVGNMYPPDGTANSGTGYDIYIQVFKQGVTESGGQGGGISCQIYYGSVSSFGGSWSNINTQSMTYNADIGNNDEYRGTLTLTTGLYEYTCRCSDDGGSSWTWNAGPNGRLTVNAPLDVNWGPLTAQNKSGQYDIRWIIYGESNNSHFEVLSSYDGKSYDVIGTVPSEGDHNTKKEYAFSAPIEGRKYRYFRIRQVDLDGTMDNGPQTELLGRDHAQLQVFPNPANDYIHIEGVENPSTVMILDAQGRIIPTCHIDGSKVDISTLPLGTYYVSTPKGSRAIIKQ